MPDSGPRHSVNRRWSLTITGLIVLASQSGCLIAAWPAPEVGSGQEIEFRDYYTKTLIEEDGLLIVHRKYDVGSPWLAFRGAPSNHVVDIRGGKARIPKEWAIWTCWVGPFMLPYYHGILPVPVPALMPPGDLTLIPLIPGYFASPHHFNGGHPLRGNTLRLSLDGGTPWVWWLSHLRRRYEERPSTPDLRLRDAEYVRVKRFIEAELRRSERTRDRARRWLGRKSNETR